MVFAAWPSGKASASSISRPEKQDVVQQAAERRRERALLPAAQNQHAVAEVMQGDVT